MKKLLIVLALFAAYLILLNWFAPYYSAFIKHNGPAPPNCDNVAPKYIIERMKFHGIKVAEEDGKGWYRFKRDKEWCKL